MMVVPIVAMSLIGLTLLVMSAIFLTNLFFFPHLSSGMPLLHSPGKRFRISILVPARNEADQIGACVAQILGQSVDFEELLVLDDASEDRTAAVALEAAHGDPRVQVIPGSPLPPGWVGKNWACHQLAQAAQGDLLIFCDADVRWRPEALAAVVEKVEVEDADLLSVWPTQATESLGERLVVPLMALVVHAYLPILAVHHTPFPIFAAANGQLMVFQRAAYILSGGHRSVRNDILEDVALARRVKRAKLKLRLVEGDALVLCRMYRGWRETRDGFAKNILRGYGGVPGLIGATLFHWILFIGPWIALVLGAFGVQIPGWPLAPVTLALLGIILRASSAHVTHQRPLDALLMPLSVILMTIIASRALYWHLRYGGPLWRGRVAATEDSE